MNSSLISDRMVSSFSKSETDMIMEMLENQALHRDKTDTLPHDIHLYILRLWDLGLWLRNSSKDSKPNP